MRRFLAGLSRPPRGRVRGNLTLALTSLLLAIPFASVQPVSAQLQRTRSVVIRGATVYTMRGAPLSDATVVIRGGKIAAVGRDLRFDPRAEVIDGTGKSVTPGLIDAQSALGRQGPYNGSFSPATRVVDDLNPFATDAFVEVLRAGVTTVYVGSGRYSGFGGIGAVFKVVPGKPLADVLIEAESSVAGGVGVVRIGSVARLMEVEGLRKQLEAARKYREAWEDYDEELEEYEEKLEERRKETDDSDGDEKKDSDEAEPGESKDSPEAENEPKKEPENPDPPKPKDDDELDSQAFGLLRRSRSGGSGEEGDAKPTSEKEGEKKDDEDELQKPQRPRVDPSLAVLARVLDGGLRVRIMAHRAEDMLNVLDLASEFALDLVLEGASEAYRIADRLAKAKIPVVLGTTLLSPLPRSDGLRFHRPGNASRLAEAKVAIALGSSGYSAAESRFLRANAAAAVSHGLDRTVALEAMTSTAAKILGIDDRVGTIEAGMDADLVIFSGDPLDTRSVVEAVFVDGVALKKGNSK